LQKILIYKKEEEIATIIPWGQGSGFATITLLEFFQVISLINGHICHKGNKSEYQ